MTSNNIASERKRARLTQAELAGKLGVALGTISNWETGNTEIKSQDIIKMSKIFGCSTDYLLNLTQERNHRDIREVYHD